MGRAVRLLWVVVFCQMFGAASAQAQAQATGAVRGIVVDTLGGVPIEQVSVRLQATGETVLTDGQGAFTFAAVTPGAHELYVSVANIQLARRRVDVSADRVTSVTIVLTSGAGTYAESVSVVAAGNSGRAGTTPAESHVDSVALQELSGVLTNDPMRAVQALPGVTAGDDFRSEFAVRGAGPQQTGFIFEGIATPFMLHTVQQVRDGGSIAMVSSDVLEGVSLRGGSYPQRFGDRTGAELEFQMREGARDRARARVSVGVVDASAVAEGPLGSNRSGSWLISGRRSYLDLLLRRLYPDQTVNFGFTDLQVKFAVNLTSNQRLEWSATAGRSRLEVRPNDPAGPNDLSDAFNESALGVLTWRYAPRPTWSVVQRVGLIANTFRNSSRDQVMLDDGSTRDIVSRTEVTIASGSRTTLDLGGEARWTETAASEQRVSGTRPTVRERFDVPSRRIGAFIGGRFRIGGATISPGLRVDRWSIVDAAAVSPWVQTTRPLGPAVTLRAGAGLYHQAPGAAAVRGFRGTVSLGLERATHLDIGLEGRLRTNLRWQMTAYQRRDRDRLRLPSSEIRLVNGVVVSAATTTRWVNALDGDARGVEWLIERRAARGLSGWVSYALATNRYTDRVTHEHFWGDFDQRHTVNIFGTYRLSDRTSLSSRFRVGSNTPAIGYWTERDGIEYVTDVRNTLRIPAYSRLDLRVNRVFPRRRGRLTLHAEVLNVLNHANKRTVPTSVNRRTFEASGLFESILPLVPSAGVVIEF